MSTEVHVVAVVDGKPGNAAAIKRAIEPCITATRNEQGCLRYTLHQDQQRPDLFMFIEHWASEEILKKHGQSAHLLTMVDELEPLISRPLQVSVLKSVF